MLVVPGADAIVDVAALDELRGWRWTVTVADPDADRGMLETLAADHDMALICDIRATRAASGA